MPEILPAPPFTGIELLLIIVYLLLFGSLIYRFGALQLRGLPPIASVAAFGVKAIFGLAFITYHFHRYGINDAYNYFLHSEAIWQAKKELGIEAYFRLAMGANDTYLSPAMFRYAWDSEYWSDAGAYSILRFHAIIHWFTGGYYYVNGVFMAMIMYWAGLNFYLIFTHYNYDNKNINSNNKYLVAALVFSVPSVLFWTAGIHKDGMIYACVSWALWQTTKLLHHRTTVLNVAISIIQIIIACLLLAMFRSYLLPILLVSLLIYAYLTLYNKNILIQYCSLMVLGGLTIWLGVVFLHVPLLAKLAQRQADFLAEWGNSDFTVPILQPTWQSLIVNTPRALKNAILRPYFWQADTVFKIITGIEPILLLGGVAVLWWRRQRYTATPLTYFLLTYAVANCLMIGLLLSNAGTLVRYRTVALHLLVLCVLSFCKSERKI